MVNNMSRIAIPLALAGAAVCLGATPGDQDPVLVGYRNALLAQVAKLEATMPEITRAAEAVADKLIAGGNLYAAGEEAFVIEAFWRAGGVFMLDPLKEKTALSAKDVVLVGVWMNDDKAAETVCRRAKEAGAYVLLFSPTFEEPKPPLAALCDAHVVNFAADGGRLVPPDGKARIGPTSALFDVTALWATTGEIVGALTRKGKMPVMFQSVVVPNGRVRNDKYFSKKDQSRLHFHDDLTIPPQPEGQLGRAYLDAVRRQVNGLRGPILEQLGATAALISDRLRAGGSLTVQTISHFTEFEVRTPAVPAWAHAPMPPPKPEELAAPMKPGDVYFELGYVDFRAPYLEAVRKAGGKSVVALCHTPVAPLDGLQPEMLIDSQWIYGDAAVFLPGYDVQILPTSGVLQTTIFWTVVGKVEELRAK